MMVNGVEVKVNAVSSLPVGAVPVFLGLLLLVAVLIEPYVVRRRVVARLWAWLRGRPPPPRSRSAGSPSKAPRPRARWPATGVEASGSAGSSRGATPRHHSDRGGVAGRPLSASGLLVAPAHVRHLLNYTELALLSA